MGIVLGVLPEYSKQWQDEHWVGSNLPSVLDFDKLKSYINTLITGQSCFEVNRGATIVVSRNLISECY